MFMLQWFLIQQYSSLGVSTWPAAASLHKAGVYKRLAKEATMQKN